MSKHKIPETALEHIKKLYYEENKTQAEIATLYNVGSSSVNRFFKHHGLKSIPRGGQNKIDPGHDALAQDIDNGLTNHQIATKYTASIQAVCNWMHKHGFDVNRDLFRYDQFISENRLRQLAEVERKTDREIAKIFNVRFQTIHRLRKRYGIENFTKPKNPGYDVLYDLYIKQELNQKQVARRLGVARGTLSKWLAICNIRRRTRPEQIDLALQQGKWNDTAMKGRHTQMKNRLLIGSEPQQIMIVALIVGLEPLYAEGWEVIIGQQNWCILQGCAEVDIPIIALKKIRTIKIAVEIDGIYWHEGADHSLKDYRLRDRGWKPFHFTAPDKTPEKMFPEMELFVATIRKHILSS
jgi:transposase